MPAQNFAFVPESHDFAKSFLGLPGDAGRFSFVKRAVFKVPLRWFSRLLAPRPDACWSL
jgi:hypothetical protein